MSGPLVRTHSLEFDLLLLTVVPSAGAGVGMGVGVGADSASRLSEFDLPLLTLVPSAGSGAGVDCTWRSLEFDLLPLTVAGSA